LLICSWCKLSRRKAALAQSSPTLGCLATLQMLWPIHARDLWCGFHSYIPKKWKILSKFSATRETCSRFHKHFYKHKFVAPSTFNAIRPHLQWCQHDASLRCGGQNFDTKFGPVVDFVNIFLT